MSCRQRMKEVDLGAGGVSNLGLGWVGGWRWSMERERAELGEERGAAGGRVCWRRGGAEFN